MSGFAFTLYELSLAATSIIRKVFELKALGLKNTFERFIMT